MTRASAAAEPRLAALEPLDSCFVASCELCQGHKPGYQIVHRMVLPGYRGDKLLYLRGKRSYICGKLTQVSSENFQVAREHFVALGQFRQPFIDRPLCSGRPSSMEIRRCSILVMHHW